MSMRELTANAAQPTIGALLRYEGSWPDRDAGDGCSGIGPSGVHEARHQFT